MSTRGWESVTLADTVAQSAEPSRSKYGNTRVTVDGITFDSKREATHWQLLKARAAAGEITELRHHVVFPLLCPYEDRALMVSTYEADFTYREFGKLHVVDVKGQRTQMYLLKKRWLQLQDGIRIEEA